MGEAITGIEHLVGFRDGRATQVQGDAAPAVVAGRLAGKLGGLAGLKPKEQVDCVVKAAQAGTCCAKTGRTRLVLDPFLAVRHMAGTPTWHPPRLRATCARAAQQQPRVRNFRRRRQGVS